MLMLVLKWSRRGLATTLPFWKCSRGNTWSDASQWIYSTSYPSGSGNEGAKIVFLIILLILLLSNSTITSKSETTTRLFSIQSMGGATIGGWVLRCWDRTHMGAYSVSVTIWLGHNSLFEWRKQQDNETIAKKKKKSIHTTNNVTELLRIWTRRLGLKSALLLTTYSWLKRRKEERALNLGNTKQGDWIYSQKKECCCSSLYIGNELIYKLKTGGDTWCPVYVFGVGAATSYTTSDSSSSRSISL